MNIRILLSLTLAILVVIGFPAKSHGGHLVDPVLDPAIKAGDLATVTRILNERPTLVLKSSVTGTTALHLACNNLPIAKLLIKEGANVNALSLFSGQPVHASIKAGNLEVFTFLLENGADINGNTSDGITAMHCLAWIKDPGLAKKFYDIIAVKRPGLIDDPGDCGLTPLKMCMEKGNTPVAKLLLRHGANPEFRTNGYETMATHLINPAQTPPSLN